MTVESLVNEFNSEDGAARERARRAVVRIGPPAVAELVNLIGRSGVRARWEATRALCEIGDPAAVPALVGRLEGPDSGIRWMAADGLIGIGRPSIEPLLHALIERSDSVLLRDGARRALHGLAGRDNLQSILQPVIDAIDAVEPAVVVPLAAYRALEAIRSRGMQKEEGIVIRRVCVRDWMHPNPVTVRTDTTLDEVYRLMQERQIRRVPVVRDGQLVGILSLGDVRHGLPAAGLSSSGEARQQAAAPTVESLMTRDVLTIRPDATLREAARLMLENKIGGLPVLQGNDLVGIITESDIFRVLVQEL
jgi:CBS domain-containing protein